MSNDVTRTSQQQKHPNFAEKSRRTCTDITAGCGFKHGKTQAIFFLVYPKKKREHFSIFEQKAETADNLGTSVTFI